MFEESSSRFDYFYDRWGAYYAMALRGGFTSPQSCRMFADRMYWRCENW